MVSRRTVPAALALLLHAILVATVITGLSSRKTKRAAPEVTTVELLPPPAEHAAPAPAVPAPPAASPERIRPKSKAVSKPKPPAKPKPRAVEPVVPAPPAPATASEPKPAPPAEAAAAPASSAAPPAPPAPPARTGVSIPASYAESNRKPEYPLLSRRYDEQGTVVLRVLVKADGTAGAVEIESSSGYARLDEAARGAVRSWRFHPATSDGKPISEWYQLSIPFKLRD